MVTKQGDTMKIYTTNKDILGRVAVDYKVTLEPSDYKGVDIGEGYVIIGSELKVFVKGSSVDLDQEIVDITNQYI